MEIIIKPTQGLKLIDIKEIWQYRELFYIFSWRDLKVRYKQTALGILWVIFQPLVTTFIFTFFFGSLGNVPSGKLPYALSVLCGMIYWTFFSTAVNQANTSLLANQNIIKKIYFPKIILPLSIVFTNMIDFGINLVILILFGIILGFYPSVSALVIFPLGLLVASLTAASVGILLASINIKYRDVVYILPFFIQTGIFLTPVIYSLSNMSDRNKFIMSLNPLTFSIESTRFVFSGDFILNPWLAAISILSTIALLCFSLWYFSKTEQFFADIV